MAYRLHCRQEIVLLYWGGSVDITSRGIYVEETIARHTNFKHVQLSNEIVFWDIKNNCSKVIINIT
jgi:hypothetical protein